MVSKSNVGEDTKMHTNDQVLLSTFWQTIPASPVQNLHYEQLHPKHCDPKNNPFKSWQYLFKPIGFSVCIIPLHADI